LIINRKKHKKKPINESLFADADDDDNSVWKKVETERKAKEALKGNHNSNDDDDTPIKSKEEILGSILLATDFEARKKLADDLAVQVQESKKKETSKYSTKSLFDDDDEIDIHQKEAEKKKAKEQTKKNSKLDLMDSLFD